MGTANQQPGPSLNAGLAELGITPTFSGGAYNDPQDLPVFTGRKPPRNLRQEYLTGGVREQDIPANLPSVVGAGSTRRQSELELDLYRSGTDIGTLQRRLWAGGFYARGADPNDVALGVPDPLTEQAWKNAVGRAASYYAAGQEMTVDEVIDMAAGIGAGPGGRSGGTAGGRQPLTVELTNPEDLRNTVQAVAVQTLGRGLDQGEVERFVSSFHGAQRGAQTATGTATQAPQAAVAAGRFAREQAPTEAGAHDFLRVYDAFGRILARRGR